MFESFLCFQESERAVTTEEGIALAKDLGCLFFECSAKTGENVQKCFEEQAQQVRSFETTYLILHKPKNMHWLIIPCHAKKFIS